MAACTNEVDDSLRSQYRDIAWDDLKPEEEKIIETSQELPSLKALNDWNASEQYSDLPGLGSGYYGAPPQANSVGVVAEMDGEKVRLPGFIVPVEFEAGNLVTEFFLVPYFGACFHKPPPPPNQTIYVTSAEPIQYESIYDPVWIMGVMKTEQQGNEIATAAYSIDFHVLEPFIE